MGKKVEGWHIAKRKYVVLTEDKLVSESSVFTVDPSTSFLTLFGENHGSDAEEALRQTAKQVTKKRIKEKGENTKKAYKSLVAFCLCHAWRGSDHSVSDTVRGRNTPSRITCCKTRSYCSTRG